MTGSKRSCLRTASGSWIRGADAAQNNTSCSGHGVGTQHRELGEGPASWAAGGWATGDVYLNFIGNEGSDRVRAGFGAHNWDRLVAVKREFDPENQFRLNHNIDPS